MKVKLIQSQDEIVLVEIARVSSSRSEEEKRDNPDILINYLIKNNHWSPFEHTYMTLVYNILFWCLLDELQNVQIKKDSEL